MELDGNIDRLIEEDTKGVIYVIFHGTVTGIA
jgi:hypothetical protein